MVTDLSTSNFDLIAHQRFVTYNDIGIESITEFSEEIILFFEAVSISEVSNFHPKNGYRFISSVAYKTFDQFRN
ncbi:hypothetical protein HNY73_008855 [Argiope bruennichi]|uniref:Uncharacterized protein n=1 Tax=Argiope bruennichi TaxID=94029 RepID=A0A8T0FE77_ARGBR|nr:hypothetical protein HNY73_008855 [Argiope bruennichi]